MALPHGAAEDPLDLADLPGLWEAADFLGGVCEECREPGGAHRMKCSAIRVAVVVGAVECALVRPRFGEDFGLDLT